PPLSPPSPSSPPPRPSQPGSRRTRPPRRGANGKKCGGVRQKELCDNIIRPLDDEIKDQFFKAKRKQKSAANRQDWRDTVVGGACEKTRICTASKPSKGGELSGPGGGTCTLRRASPRVPAAAERRENRGGLPRVEARPMPGTPAWAVGLPEARALRARAAAARAPASGGGPRRCTRGLLRGLGGPRRGLGGPIGAHLQRPGRVGGRGVPCGRAVVGRGALPWTPAAPPKPAQAPEVPLRHGAVGGSYEMRAAEALLGQSSVAPGKGKCKGKGKGNKGKGQDLRELPTIVFNDMELKEVPKDFGGIEHPAVRARTVEESKRIWLSQGIRCHFHGREDAVAEDEEDLPKPIVDLDELPFPDWVAKELRALGWEKPTPIQDVSQEPSVG
ncbi:unnamed protein product, partial [Prorocentrum cordatum]